jgi:hypothetical protein
VVGNNLLGVRSPNLPAGVTDNGVLPAAAAAAEGVEGRDRPPGVAPFLSGVRGSCLLTEEDDSCCTRQARRSNVCSARVGSCSGRGHGSQLQCGKMQQTGGAAGQLLTQVLGWVGTTLP